MNASTTLKPLLMALIAVLALDSAPTFAAGKGHLRQGGQLSACPVVAAGTQATAEEAASLAFMREEEKLAYDVYQVLASQWQAQSPVFGNIMRSEQTHMTQIKCLLDAYGLPDSALAEAGQFANAELQGLYTDLTTRGAASLSEALRVGALIEEVDIEDLTQALTSIQAPEIRLVYDNLIRGSENHLRAFTGALARLGETYAPQVLTEETLTTVLTPALVAPPVFELNSLTLRIPSVRLSLGEQLLPEEETYQLELRYDGKAFQLSRIQRVPAAQTTP